MTLPTDAVESVFARTNLFDRVNVRWFGSRPTSYFGRSTVGTLKRDPLPVGLKSGAEIVTSDRWSQLGNVDALPASVGGNSTG